MVRSMTGFGRANALINGLDVTIEIKSVNHRYFEFSCRMPRAYQFAEEKLKALCQQSISRGKIELSVFVEETAESSCIGHAVMSKLMEKGVFVKAQLMNTGNDFITHGSVGLLREKCGIDAIGIADTADSMSKNG